MTSLDEAIVYRRKVAAEKRSLTFRAMNAVRLRRARTWAKKVELDYGGGSSRAILKLLVEISARDKKNDGARWRCEPRQASIAKKLDIHSRTVGRCLAKFVREGIAIKVILPERKRTRGRSCYAYYLAVDGAEAAYEAAIADGVPARLILTDTKAHTARTKSAVKHDYKFWNQLRPLIFERDNYTCRYCGSTDETNLTIDHIHPVSRGGTDSLNNLATCCGACNSSKCARTLDEWQEWLKTRPETDPDSDTESGNVPRLLGDVLQTSNYQNPTGGESSQTTARSASPPCSAWDRIPVTPSPCGEDAPVTGFDERNPPPLLADYGPSCPGEPCDGWRMCA